MASKRSKAAAPPDDELGELFQGIGSDSKKPSAAAAGPAKTRKAATAAASATPAAASGSPAAAAAAPSADAGDILAELENQLDEPVPSRSHTPRLGAGSRAPPIKTSIADEKAAARKSAESIRSSHNQPTSAVLTPSASGSENAHDGEKSMSFESAPVQQQPPPAAAAATGGGGGWWGGLVSTATAAMRQAEAAVKEIQQNEEAKKWADQVRGINVGALKGFGDEIRSRALPTFTNILHTLAPPISSHERLLIHITHDLVGYPALEPLVHSVFSRVMAQVEGGDLMVVQRGHEATIRSPRASTSSDGEAHGRHKSTSSALAPAFGWRDGPWWRQADTGTADGAPRDLGLVKGLREGTKLCRAAADAYAADFLAARGGIDAARQRAAEPVSESNPVRSSDLFLAVQAVLLDPQIAAVFSADTGKKPAAAKKAKKDDEDDDDDDDDDDEDDEDEEDSGAEDEADKELVAFAISVLDPIHKIQFATVSQTIPARWIRWLDADPAATAPLTPASDYYEDAAAAPSAHGPTGGERVPLEIRAVIESGAVDPREWVAEWVEESLNLAVGVLAQRYVARRMGVGMSSEGRAAAAAAAGIAKGKRRERTELPGVTEAAKAGIV